jgi:hypothetical protein
VAKDTVVIRKDRRVDSKPAFTVTRGERVEAMTGVVVTTKARRVQFWPPIALLTSSDPLHINPGETLFLLTYEGEGFSRIELATTVRQDPITDLEGGRTSSRYCHEEDQVSVVCYTL